MTTIKCELILDDEQFDKYTDFLAWLKEDKEWKGQVDKGLGKCKEKNCPSFASKDYNGHGHYVCDFHYTELSNYFDEEYK